MLNIKGVPLVIAALATSVIQWSSLGGSLLSAVSDRVGLRKPFLYGGMFGVIVGLVGLYYLFPPLLFVFIGISAIGVQIHLSMQLLVLNEIEGIGPRLAGTAEGIGSSFRFIGSWLANLTTGFIIQQTGAPNWAVLLFIVAVLSSYPFTFLFKECGPKSKNK
jgi:sugar phosphate permease